MEAGKGWNSPAGFSGAFWTDAGLKTANPHALVGIYVANDEFTDAGLKTANAHSVGFPGRPSLTKPVELSPKGSTAVRLGGLKNRLQDLERGQQVAPESFEVFQFVSGWFFAVVHVKL